MQRAVGVDGADFRKSQIWIASTWSQVTPRNRPGCLIAMFRLNRPAVFVYGGTILPGRCAGQKVDIVSVFEAVGKRARGEISDRDLAAIEFTAIPGPGSCGGMYTANTRASAIEALGMSLPNSGAKNAVSAAKRRDCREAGRAVMQSAKYARQVGSASFGAVTDGD